MKISLQIIRLVVFIFSIHPILGQSQVSTISGTSLSSGDLDEFINRQMEKLQIPGLSIAVINDDQIVYNRSFGVKNTNTKLPIDSATIFEAASLSKPLFSYFVLKQVEKGTIDLDKPLYHYLPNPELDHDERYLSMTARHVLSHTTGLPNWRYMLDKLNVLSLQFEPGEQFAYSGEAYEYLANTIVHLNGGTLADLETIILEEVLFPLKMQNSGFVWNERLAKDKANGHAMPNLPNNRYKPTIARVSGGLHSNAKDYAKFILALLKQEGLTTTSFDLLLRPAVELPGNNEIRERYGIQNWTLGFGYEKNLYGEKISHGGNNGDFQSYFEFYRNQGIGYVFMTNCNKGDELNNTLNEMLTLGSLRNRSNEIYEVENRQFELIDTVGYNGIALTARDQAGFAWLKGMEFSTGSIEFDVRGENLREQSFVGIAFHAQNSSTYDCIYLRPYLFQSQDAIEQNYMIQYISMPQMDWFNLRSAYPGIYEAKIQNPPEEEDWTHMKIEIRNDLVEVYANHASIPNLKFKPLNDRYSGKIGFWVGNGSKGDFANLKITPY